MNQNYPRNKTGQRSWLRTACWLTLGIVCTTGLYGQAQVSTNAPATRTDNCLLVPPQSEMSAHTVLDPTASHAQTSWTLADLIEGRVAGVQVTGMDGAPGSSFSIRIRGVRSIRGYNEPLYVLDGVLLNRVDRDAVSAFWGDELDCQATQNTLSAINPNDIESIHILRDAAATAIYGAAGANGVVCITTRQGRTDSPEVYVSAAAGLSSMPRTIDMLDKAGYLSYIGTSTPSGLPFTPGDQRDWQREASRIALAQSYYLSVSGRTERMNYLISAGFGSQDGTVERSGITNGTVRLNLDRRLSKRTVLGVRAVLGYREQDMIAATSPYGSQSAIKSMTTALPFMMQYEQRSILTENPLDWIHGTDDNSLEYSAVPSVFVETSLAKGLHFRVLGGLDYRNKERVRWLGGETMRGNAVNGQAGHSNSNLLRYNVDAAFDYHFIHCRHSLTALAGATFQGDQFANHIIGGTGFFNHDMRGYGIALAETIFQPQNIETQSQSIAGFANLTYTYDERYSVGLTARADKTFRYDHGAGDLAWYPAVSASWDVAREHFISSSRVLTQLKLRGSWGRSGAESYSPYLLATGYITGIEPQLEFPDGVTNYYDLRWQNLSEQWDAGVDVSLWQGRLTFTADAYRTLSRDNLRWYSHSRYGDWEPVYSNRSRVENKGLEFTLGGIPVTAGKFRWEAGANFSVNVNRIMDTGSADGSEVFGSSVGTIGGLPLILNAAQTGSAVGSFWGYRTQGIVEERHVAFAPPFMGQRLVAGDVKFFDVNGDGNVDGDDRTTIGNPNPKYLFGFHSSFKYGGFSLNFLIEGALKFDVLNLSRLGDTYTSGNLQNLRSDTYRQVYPAGDQPRFDAVGVTEVSSRLVEDGSYLRLSNLSLGYTVPLQIKWVKSLDVTLTGRNLWVLTDYSGYDPQCGSYGFDLTRMGIDNGAYPLARTFLVGIRATF